MKSSRRLARGPVLRPARVDARTLPAVPDLLAAAVAGIGGAERPGQVAMAEAVERSIRSGEHLAVQAGTGTGKSLAYLVPAVAHALASGSAVVVATATIALQRQLIDRDLPRLAATLKPLLGREPEFAILKGRRNYLCLHRLKSGAPEDPRDVLFDRGATSAVGQQVERVHAWAAETTTGDRDELVPGVDDRAWRQVSVSARECLGAQRCPFGRECYAEQARITAGKASIVVTNHALLAINALESFPVLPEHDVVIIDEAHDLVNRVTGAASGELSATGVDAAARRVGRLLSADAAGRLREAGEAAARAFAESRDGRLDFLDDDLSSALALVRDAAAGCATEIRSSAKQAGEDSAGRAASRDALGAGRPGRPGGHRGPDPGLVRPGPHLADRRGLDGPADGRGPTPPGHAPGGPAAGRRAARGALVPPPDRGADLGDAGSRRVVRAAGPAVGTATPRGRGRPARDRAARDRRRDGTPGPRQAGTGEAGTGRPGPDA